MSPVPEVTPLQVFKIVLIIALELTTNYKNKSKIESI